MRGVGEGGRISRRYGTSAVAIRREQQGKGSETYGTSVRLERRVDWQKER